MADHKAGLDALFDEWLSDDNPHSTRRQAVFLYLTTIGTDTAINLLLDRIEAQSEEIDDINELSFEMGREYDCGE
jgi:hypothetical protein